MKFILYSVLVFCFGSVAWGQAKTSTQYLDFKGLPMNVAEKDLREKFPDALCNEAFQPEKPFADRICRLRQATLAEVPMDSVVFGFFADKLSTIYVSYNSKDYDQVIAAAREKYGKPKSESVSQVRNGLGAVFENVTTTWRKGTSSLVSFKYQSTLELSSLVFQLDSATKEIEKRKNQGAKEKAKDM